MDGPDRHRRHLLFTQAAHESEPLGQKLEIDIGLAGQELHSWELCDVNVHRLKLLDRLVRLIQMRHHQEDGSAEPMAQRRRQNDGAGPHHASRGRSLPTPKKLGQLLDLWFGRDPLDPAHSAHPRPARAASTPDRRIWRSGIRFIARQS